MESGFGFEILEGGLVNEGIGVALGRGAHVDVSLHLEESIVAPSCSPGILYVPELHSVLSTVSDGQHCVIHIFLGLSALVGGIHSGFVVLEPSDDLVGDRDGPCVVESLGQFLLVSLGDVETAVLDVAD